MNNPFTNENLHEFINSPEIQILIKNLGEIAELPNNPRPEEVKHIFSNNKRILQAIFVTGIMIGYNYKKLGGEHVKDNLN